MHLFYRFINILFRFRGMKFMGIGLDSQEQMYERSWEHSIAAGKEQHGNLEVNLAWT